MSPGLKRRAVVFAIVPKVLADDRALNATRERQQNGSAFGLDPSPPQKDALELNVDGACRYVCIPEYERSHLDSHQLLVELPSDKARRPISSPADLSQALQAAIQTQPSNCGSLKGVRALRKGQKGKRIVYFASLKNRAQMQCESRLEAAHAFGYEDSSQIRTYRCQPIRIWFNGFHYTPDVLLQDNCGTFSLYEVKPAGKLENLETASRLAVIQALLSRHRLPFGVLTERSDRLLLPDRTLIYTRMSMQRRTDLLHDAVNKLLCPSKTATLESLRTQAAELGFPAGAIERLLWDRKLFADGSIETPKTTLVGLLSS